MFGTVNQVNNDETKGVEQRSLTLIRIKVDDHAKNAEHPSGIMVGDYHPRGIMVGD